MSSNKDERWWGGRTDWREPTTHLSTTADKQQTLIFAETRDKYYKTFTDVIDTRLQ